MKKKRKPAHGLFFKKFKMRFSSKPFRIPAAKTSVDFLAFAC